MKFISKLLHYLILKALLHNGYTKKKTKVALFESVEHDFNKDYASIYNIRILPDKITLDLSIELIRELNDDIWCRIAVKKCAQKYQKCYDLLHYDVNTCSLKTSKDSGKNDILQYWMQNAFKWGGGNIPRSCILQKGNYSWHNLKPLNSYVPPFILRGLYLTNSIIYRRTKESNITIFNTTLGTRLR